MNIIAVILLLSLLIIVHEFGHYICAVATGMRVDRFSILGIGPPILRLFSFKGTEFVISAIPFGAYVHIVGMEAPGESSPEDQQKISKDEANEAHLFRNRPLWARMLTILGGPLANYVAAMAIFFGIYSLAGVENPRVLQVATVSSESAKAAGLEAGDQLVQVAGQELASSQPSKVLAELTSTHAGQTIDVVVERDGQAQTLQVPVSPEGLFGIEITHPRVPVGIAESAKAAVTAPFIISKEQLSALGRKIIGKGGGKMVGPVGIVRNMAERAKSGVLELIWFGGVISTLLGLFNLLPIPALDGGRLVFLGYELIARKPTNRRVEEWVHGIGMLALLAMIAIVTIRDVTDIFN